MPTRKQTGLTYEPPDAPGVVVEYTLHPEQPGIPATRDSDGQEHIPAWVEVETVTCGNLSADALETLGAISRYLNGRAKGAQDAEAALYLSWLEKLLSTKPANLLPWLQLHGADEDTVCEKLAEGILGNHR